MATKAVGLSFNADFLKSLALVKNLVGNLVPFEFSCELPHARDSRSRLAHKTLALNDAHDEVIAHLGCVV
jgi:hypothetical protein